MEGRWGGVGGGGEERVSEVCIKVKCFVVCFLIFFPTKSEEAHEHPCLLHIVLCTAGRKAAKTGQFRKRRRMKSGCKFKRGEKISSMYY